MKGCDSNQGDCAGNTPLVWPTILGHERLVRLLLKHEDIDPNVPDKSGQIYSRGLLRMDMSEQ